MGGVAAVGSAAEAAREASSKTHPVSILSRLPAGRPQPPTVFGGNTADGREREVKRHQVHVIGNGAFHELATGDEGAVGGQVESVLPGRPLQGGRGGGGTAPGVAKMVFRGNAK